MKKVINIILIFLMISSTINAAVSTTNNGATTSDGKMVTPLYNLIKTTQWDLFMTEFDMTLETGLCGEGLKLAIGFKSTMIEPIGYTETSKKRLHFVFADFDISESQTRTSVDSYSGTGAPSSTVGVKGYIYLWLSVLGSGAV